MALKRLDKCPWPWFGGKADAAPHVWEALGDVVHYVEPFAGSLAVLLRRPHPCNRTYHSETVNDLDGLLVNAWRSIQMSPEATAEAASWPVSEADLHARHLALLKWREERQLEHLMGDPEWHDPKMAGWWAWGQSCWIGAGWCCGKGAWVVGSDGRIIKRERSGVSRSKPQLGNDGRGVNRPQTREPGVSVSKSKPHLGNNGRGVNQPQTREPGVSVSKSKPHLGNDGKGVNQPQTREPGVGDYHPMTMPELLRWFHFLSARLRHVRIVNGDWTRVCTNGVLKILSLRQSKSNAIGVFLDPPYSTAAKRKDELYSIDSLTVAQDVHNWCLKQTNKGWLRIVLAGFDGEHNELEEHGWRVVEWYRSGFLKGGMANTAGNSENSQQKRERLWLSPSCERGERLEMKPLF